MNVNVAALVTTSAHYTFLRPGLGTSTAKEAKEYFSDMVRHKIDFSYTGTEDDASINLAFSKKKVEERKEWLSNWMEERKRRTEMGLPEVRQNKIFAGNFLGQISDFFTCASCIFCT